MPRYHTLGKIPHKRHTVFRKEDGSLYHEQLFGTVGFDGMSSLLYHNYPPTQVLRVEGQVDLTPKIAVGKNMTMKSFQGFEVST
jgi:homogentisate 1,2-dioxygenase